MPSLDPAVTNRLAHLAHRLGQVGTGGTALHRTAEHAGVCWEARRDVCGVEFISFWRVCEAHGLALSEFTTFEDAAGCVCPGCEYEMAVRSRPWIKGFVRVGELGIVDERR